jgi:GT2 family glycosyltransferase
MPRAERRLGFLPTKVVHVDLAHPVQTITDLDGYVFARIVVRVASEVVGVVTVPVHGDRCPGSVIAHAISSELAEPLLRVRLLATLEQPMRPRRYDLASVVGAVPNDDPHDHGMTRSMTVAVCTRDRVDQLDECLASLQRMRHPVRVLVVDNAPSTDSTARLVRDRYPAFDYVLEPRPGLDHARNRAIAETTSEILAFTDDDVIVDERWSWAVVRAFAEEPDLCALTGLVLPCELEAPAQELFERLGGFGKGFTRRWITSHTLSNRPGDGDVLRTGPCGTGANMAFRTSEFDRIGGFDPALGAGTPSRGGDDLEMFHRVLVAGGSLRYEPAAIVYHRHRRTLAELRSQMYGNGGLWAMMMSARMGGRTTATEIIRVMSWYVKYYWSRRIFRSLVIPNRTPIAIPVAELRGILAASVGRAYVRSRRVNPESATPPIPPAVASAQNPATRVACSITVDLDGTISSRDVPLGTGRLSVTLAHGTRTLGQLDMDSEGRTLSDRQLRERIVDELGSCIPIELRARRGEVARQEALAAVSAAVRPPGDGSAENAAYSVSIIVVTADRPTELRRCLDSIRRHRSRHEVQIVVVDNRPSSRLTPTVVAHFHHVVLVDEPRPGVARARNTGFLAARGEVLVTIDDGVEVGDGWLDNLLEPFARNDVMAVCGIVQRAQHDPGRLQAEPTTSMPSGSARVESFWINPLNSWRPVPVWALGTAANAAFRTSVLSDPEVARLDGAFSIARPWAGAEDSHLLYRIVRAGYTVVHEPAAFVWSMGGATPDAPTAGRSGPLAHHFSTLVRDRDLRAVVGIAATTLERLRSVLATPGKFVAARRRATAEPRDRGPSASCSRR